MAISDRTHRVAYHDNGIPFPLPIGVSVRHVAEEACRDQGADCYRKTFMHVSKIDADKNKYIDVREAQEYVALLRFGHHPALEGSAVARGVLSAVQRLFFGGSPFDGNHSTIIPRIFSTETIWFADGDTFSVKVPAGRQPVSVRFRFSGVDTPESIWRFPKDGEWVYNSKLVSQVEYTWRYFSAYAGIPGKYKEAAQRLIRDRIVYAGLLAGAASKGLGKWAKENNIPISVGASFDRATPDPAMCNGVVLADKYGRSLGVPRLGVPGEERHILAYFIANILPRIMADEGAGHYGYYRTGVPRPGSERKEDVGAFTKDGMELLKRLGSRPDDRRLQAVWQALAPETLADPARLFSQARCVELARRWVRFTTRYPGFKNDIQAMLAFLGLAFAYPKYRMQNTDVFLVAEAAAMGPLIKLLDGKEIADVGPVPESGGRFCVHGLWNDPIFRLMQPNPLFSPLYRHYGGDLAGDRELLPRDCCEILERQGGDVYDHCP